MSIFFLTGCATERYHKGSDVEGTGVQVFRRPLNGPVVFSFGEEEDGVSLKGIVLRGAQDQPVSASRNGRVVFVNDRLRGYGRILIIEHDSVFSTVYAGCSELLVSEGQWVRQGQPVARVGNAGKGGVPRLYFEVRKNARPEDPLLYLT